MRFKQYKNEEQTLSLTPVGIAVDLINTYNHSYQVTSDNLVLYGEALLDVLAHSNLDECRADPTNIVNVLYYLNRKIEAARKTFSFWDAYQIRDTVHNRDTALGQLASIPANSSIVSNLRDPFSWFNAETNREETVYQGDIFIKDYEERLHLLHTLSTGWYYPISTENKSGNTIEITYAYTSDQQDDVINSFNITSPDWKGYNFSEIVPPHTLSPTAHVLRNTDGIIYPVVKVFTTDGEVVGEQVFLDQAYIIINNTTFKLNNSSAFPLRFEVK